MRKDVTMYEELKKREERKDPYQEKERKDNKKRIIFGILTALSLIAATLSMTVGIDARQSVWNSKDTVESSIEEFESYYENGDIKEAYYTREEKLYEIHYTFTETDIVGYFEVPVYNPENLNEKNTFVDEYSIVETEAEPGLAEGRKELAIRMIIFVSLLVVSIMCLTSMPKGDKYYN